jgi:hypothetical protein
MRINLRMFNTLPTRKDPFFQIVFIPTVSLLNSMSRDDKYIAINLEWLFWSFTTIFEYDAKR